LCIRDWLYVAGFFPPGVLVEVELDAVAPPSSAREEIADAERRA
jgi:hypothetical protein